MNTNQPLVNIKNLSLHYKTRLGPVSAVDHVTFDINRSEILGLVGESGSGKSTLGKALLMMSPQSVVISSGEILFNGEDILKYNARRLRDFRGRQASMIFQDPMTSLNPVQRIDEHMVEAIQVHEKRTPLKIALERTRTLVERLGIMSSRMNCYPHQLSGGMRQRVMVGLGLILNANLIVADEATTSLDVIVEAKLVDQLRQIRTDYGVSILVISHNIALVAEIADRVAVMYAGNLVELGNVNDIFHHPLHPYTQGLLASVPNIKLHAAEELYKMPGEPPNLTHPPSGCRFHPRCDRCMPICTQYCPEFIPVSESHYAHCWLYQKHPEEQQPAVKVTI